MSKYFNRFHRHERKSIFSKLSHLLPGLRAARTGLIFAVAGSGILFVVIGNMNTAKAYELRALEAKFADLKTQNRKLELEVVKANAAESVASQVESLGLVPASSVAYLEGGETHVAKK